MDTVFDRVFQIVGAKTHTFVSNDIVNGNNAIRNPLGTSHLQWQSFNPHFVDIGIGWGGVEHYARFLRNYRG